MSKGNSGGGAGVGGGAAGGGGSPAAPSGNEAQRKYPHLANVLNNVDVVDTARTKQEAKEKTQGLRRNESGGAFFMKDPKGKGRERYLIVRPKS